MARCSGNRGGRSKVILAHHRVGETLVLTLEGNVACIRQSDLMDRFTEPFVEGLRNLILDMQGVEYIDSTAIGALVTLRSAVMARQGELVFAAVPSSVRNIFSIIRFNTLFRFFDGAEAALKALEGAGS